MIKPYESTENKKKQVEDMFDGISGSYDFLNRFLSAGVDKKWRKKVRKMVANVKHSNILDVATGTADLCVELAKLNEAKLMGIDLSAGMLEVGKNKIEKLNLTNRITLQQADSEKLPFDDNTFDVITVAFGVRNFENLERGLAECLRVLKPEGNIFILEFSNPTKFPVKQAFNFYSGKVMPTVGGWFSKDKKAYKYLHESSRAFPNGNNFLNVMQQVGYKNSTATQLSFGIASIYKGTK